MTDRPTVMIYTDGACSGNPGPGGYGVVMLLGERRREISAGYRLTTNNRMEIMAALAGLAALKFPCDVILCTDSQYLCDGIMKGWALRWRANGWRKRTGEPALNRDLWEQLLAACDIHHVTFEWVRGHAENPENERCDRLAVGAAKSHDLLIDEEYENPTPLPATADPPPKLF